MTRRHVTVALSGDGADELFAGYRRYMMGVAEDQVRQVLPVWFRRSVVSAGARHYPKFDYLPRVFRAKATLSGIASEVPDAYFSAMTSFRDETLEAILAPEARLAMCGYSPRAAYRERFQPFAHLPALQQMQAVDMQTYLPGDILVKVDRATMAHSLESRAPWLDHRLAELSCRLPAGFKLRGRIGKHVFKEAVRPYVPAELVDRPKRGFVIPLSEWFRTSLKPIFESTVLHREMQSYLSLGEVRRVWKEHQSGVRNHQSKLWYLLMLARWDERHRRQAPQRATASETQ